MLNSDCPLQAGLCFPVPSWPAHLQLLLLAKPREGIPGLVMLSTATWRQHWSVNEACPSARSCNLAEQWHIPSEAVADTPSPHAPSDRLGPWEATAAHFNTPSRPQRPRESHQLDLSLAATFHIFPAPLIPQLVSLPIQEFYLHHLLTPSGLKSRYEAGQAPFAFLKAVCSSSNAHYLPLLT